MYASMGITATAPPQTATELMDQDKDGQPAPSSPPPPTAATATAAVASTAPKGPAFQGFNAASGFDGSALQRVV